MPEVEKDAGSNPPEVTLGEKKPTLGSIINIRDFELAAPKLIAPRSFACKYTEH